MTDEVTMHKQSEARGRGATYWRLRLAGWLERRRQMLLLTAAIGLAAMAAVGARGYISDQIALETAAFSFCQEP